jgi:hypothetical protein
VHLSFFGTSVVFANLLFLAVIAQIFPNLSLSLSPTSPKSLIPSVYVSVMVTLVFHCLPLLSHPTPPSLLHSLLHYPLSVLSLLSFVYKLKLSLAQIYSFLTVISFAVSFAALGLSGSDGFSHQLWDICFETLHPLVVLTEAIVFLLMTFAMHFILRVISATVGRVAIVSQYSKKNPNTKVPIIL